MQPHRTMPPATTKRKADSIDDSDLSPCKTKPFKGTWKISGDAKTPSLMWYQHKTCQNKIAGFDMDHTLIKPKSGAKFPKNRSDWEYMHSTKIKKKLCQLQEDGHSIVLFTNQAGIEKKKQKAADIQGKIEDLEKDLGIPIHAVVAGANDHFRKPACSMWTLLEKKYGTIDRSESFYCGDAAGRPKGWKKGAPKDFSSGDRSFAVNLGVKFYLPEECFFNENCSSVPFSLDGFDPQKLLDNEAAQKFNVSGKQEMVVFVGWPASGKSSLYRSIFAPKGFLHVNQDLLGTKEKCHKAARKALESGQSVAIDNTNPAAADRKPYIDMAKSKRIAVRCIRLGTTREVSVHNNYFRVKETKGKVRRIPAVAYNIFNKKLEEPTVREGFESVETVAFSPDFANLEKKKLYLERVEKA